MNFGNKSKTRLSEAHPDLQLIMNEAIKVSQVDFSIIEAHRSTERQQLLYKKGLTALDGVAKQSKHNKTPSMAVDIMAYSNEVREIGYDPEHLCYLGGVITAIANNLFIEGMIEHRIRWGYNWDGDGLLVGRDPTERFKDMPHFELIN